jgi:ligand-binding SRPBCC domain-containing protein
MPRIELEHRMRAPIERVFDLSLSVEVHVLSTKGTGERPIAGVTSGLMGPGHTVTWSAVHLGVRQQLTSEIHKFDRPMYFADRQVRGAFAEFEHEHWFVEDGDVTICREVFDYRSPLGPLGKLADWLFLEAYMTRFLQVRADTIKELVEGDGWKDYLPSQDG